MGDGRYEIGDRLGEGARKVVYRGTDSRLGRDVAVALIKTDGLDAHGRARVQREARAMARLGDHPHVVAVLDAGEEEGRPFIVSQLLTGGSLEDRLADTGGAVEVADALRIGRQVAEGLASAHTQGVVHRDVKPANIWFDAAGNALLGDFGLAQVADEARLTTEGMIVGTASYLAPEVAVGRDADARSDLYSFGAVLYELLTGRPPFLGDLTEVVSQHVNTAPVDPAFHNPAVPTGLDALVRRLLAKDPDERPRDAHDVVATLASVALTPAPPAVDPAPTPVPVDARFVGRASQLGQLRAALESALSGRAGVVFVAGEPGVGKTTLVEQLVSEAKVRGAEVLWGRSYEGEIGAPYLAFAECFRAHVQTQPQDEVRQDLGTTAPEIATLVSEVRERFGDIPTLPRLDGSAERLRLFEAVVTFLRTAARRRPLVLVLDDLHWADEPTLLLLQYLARNIERDRILVIGTYRDMELDRTHPLSDTIAVLRRGDLMERVLLRGLLREEVAALIEATGGQPPPEAFVDAVYEVSEGNPFFVAEILRNLVESGAIRVEDGRYVGDPESIAANLPEGVREVVGRRLDRLSAEANALLSVGSAMPGGFDLDICASVAGFDIDRALDLLDEALAAAVLTERTAAPGTYEVNHALIRQALYGELSTPRRVRMHQRIGEAIEAKHAERLDPHLTELAYHFFQAAPGGEAERARAYALRAGDRALEAAAYEEAARYFDMVLQVIDLDAQAAPAERGDILVRLLEATELAGTRSGASRERVLDEAVECARRANDPLLFTRAVITVGRRSFGGAERADTHLIDLLREAIDRVSADDHASRADLASCLTRQLFIHDLGAAGEAAALAMEEAEASGDAAVRARAMHAAGVAVLPGKEGLDFVQRFVALAEEAGDLEVLYTAVTSLFFRHLIDGRRDELEEALDRLAAIAEKLRSPRFDSALDQHRAMTAAMDGRFEEAEALLFASLTAGRRMGNDVMVANAGVGLYHPWREQGRLGALLEPTRRTVASADALMSWRGGLIGLLAEIGRLDEAAEMLEVIDLDAVPEDVLRTYTLCVLAEASVLVGDRGAASALKGLIGASADAHATIAGIAYWGARSRYLGLIDHLLGDLDGAVARLRQAEDEHEAMRSPPWVARTRYDLARVLIDRDADGDRAEARRLLDAALDTAREIGAARLVEQALTEKVALQGLSGSDPGSSIDMVAAAAAADRDDVADKASPQGRVTVAFSDIEGYTSLTERVGDARSQEILHAHNDLIRAALRDHGGTEVKSQGDGFMVVFDRPASAVAWATQVHTSMTAHDFGPDVDRLRIRIGMHEGDVISEEADFYGRTVILAARVGALARGGDTLVTDHLRSLLGDEVSFGAPVEVELKGLSGTHRLHPVV